MTSASPRSIRTRELIGWDLDAYEFRPSHLDADRLAAARAHVASRLEPQANSVVCPEQAELLAEHFRGQASRPDLLAEMHGLEWSLGVVDLRGLLAFQRRLSFHPDVPALTAPCPCDWDALMRIAFAPPHPVVCDVVHDAQSKTLVARSRNPNLHLRVSSDPTAPVALHAGSPFFEVAEYAGRWFLRDGYHRAYRLLRAGVVHLPAVIVRARTLAELGAVLPRFFPESVLLSQHPPRVVDFLDDALTFEYLRPPTITTLRISMHESIAPALVNEHPNQHPNEHPGERP